MVSYEVRAEHRDRALANVEAFFGKIPDRLELRLGDEERARLEAPYKPHPILGHTPPTPRDVARGR